MLADLQLFVTNHESRLLRRAVNEASCLSDNDIDKLTEFYTQNELLEVSKVCEIRHQLMTIATNVFITKPEPLFAQMRKGIPESHLQSSWRQVTSDNLTLSWNSRGRLRIEFGLA
jgi:hypothetical protein